MEDGDETGIRFIDCNKDHLATMNNLLKTREETRKELLACGFNGFGQLQIKKYKRKLLQFEEIQTAISGDILLACSWSCLAAAHECSLYIQGFVTNSTHTVKTLQTETPIKCLDLCDKFCLLLTENGKVYKIVPGIENDFNEVKFQTSLKHKRQKLNIFGEEKLEVLQIAHIACGNNIAIAISTTNSIFSGTIEIFQFPKHQRIKQLKCGFEHALLLTSNGDIYAWGNGLRGQLGSEVLRIEETPTLIEALAGVKITAIAAGGWHSAAISAFGDIYTWGFNSSGQLSLRVYKTSAEILKEPSVYPLPQLIDITCQCCNNSCYPVNVVAGARHTMLKMNCGSIYACGWNEYGQLGLPAFPSYCDNFVFVLKLEDLNKSTHENIVCGDWCTIIEN